jgi:tetratricopeptide (TPR) repeat protein
VFSQSAKKYYKTGGEFVTTGNYKDAIVQFTKAIDLQPDFANAYLARAGAYEKLGMLKEASQDYDRASTFLSTNSDVYYQSARLNFLLGDYQKAIEKRREVDILRNKVENNIDNPIQKALHAVAGAPLLFHNVNFYAQDHRLRYHIIETAPHFLKEQKIRLHGHAREGKVFWSDTQTFNDGKIKVNEDDINFDNFYYYFDDIRGNSEYLYFDSLADAGIGMSDAPCITDGFWYNEDIILVEYDYDDVSMSILTIRVNNGFLGGCLNNGG